YVVAVGIVHGLYPGLVGAVLAVLACSLLAYLLGRVFFRLGGLLFALVTFALALMMKIVFSLSPWLGEAEGPQLPLIQEAMSWQTALLMLHSPSQLVYLALGFFLVVVTAAMTYAIARSRFGQQLIAARDDPTLAGSCGIPVAHVVAVAWGISAAIAAAAGVVHIQSTLSIAPGFAFGLGTMSKVLVAALIGGLGTVFGPIVGSSVLLVAGWARDASSSPDAANMMQVGYALALLAVVALAPNGVLGWAAEKRRRAEATKQGRQACIRTALPERPARLRECRTEVSNGSRPQEAAEPLLRVEAISKRFSGITALDNFTFELRAAEILALVGPNGSGKTTVFNCITGVLHPDSGRIIFRDQRLERASPHTISRVGISRTYQSLRVLPRQSVLQNVSLPLLASGMPAQERRIKTLEALASVGLVVDVDRMTSDLSIAEMRLVELARAVASEARLILLDEAMVGLSRDEAGRILATIKVLQTSGVAFIVVEHSVGLIMSIAHRVIVANRGAVMADGPTSQVLADASVVEAYFGSGR
ncbi:MAG: branched-chain amino acid ABC transporter ATP-binding protein/permease, partial [Lautropia sp.]